MISKNKELGKVYTPESVVEKILSLVSYEGEKILTSYVLEPGCGDGNFLSIIVEKFIEEAKKRKLSANEIISRLQKYIFGIEINKEELNICKNRLDKIAKKYSLSGVQWSLENSDILDLDFLSLPKFDFVLGNPPYVRIQNLNDETILKIKDKLNLASNGIIDLYVCFFEIGIMSLSKRGKLGFITPNSYLKNSTFGFFRKYLVENNLVDYIEDLKHYQVFSSVSTYTAITVLSKNRTSKYFSYHEFKSGKSEFLCNQNIEKINSNSWDFTSNSNQKLLDEISMSDNSFKEQCIVQNGFATLCDQAYLLKELPTEIKEPDCPVIKKIVKGSTLLKKQNYPWIIFPYIKNYSGKYTPIQEEIFKQKYPQVYSILLTSKKKLIMRSSDSKSSEWYEYGRSQAINSVHNRKLVINPIIKDCIHTKIVSQNTMVYSGLFLWSNSLTSLSLEEYKEIIESKRFFDFVQITGKDMRGGYKNIGSKHFARYRW